MTDKGQTKKLTNAHKLTRFAQNWLRFGGEAVYTGVLKWIIHFDMLYCFRLRGYAAHFFCL